MTARNTSAPDRPPATSGRRAAAPEGGSPAGNAGRGAEPHRRRAPRRAVFWIKLAAGAALIALLIRLIDWRATVALLADASPLLVLLCIPLGAAGVVLSSWKWKILLRAHGIRVGLWQLTRYYWIAMFFSNFLPTNVGGDVVRFGLLHRLRRSAEVAASIAMERLTGLVVLLGFCAVALALRPHYFDAGGLLPVLWAAVVGLAGAIALACLLPQRLWRLIEPMTLALPRMAQRVIQALVKTSHAIASYADRKAEVAASLAITLPFYGVLVMSQYVLLVALGLHVPVWEVALVAPLIALVSMLPLTVNGLGVAEGVVVLFYSQLGLSAEAALALALLRRVVMTLTSLIGGTLWVWNRLPSAVQ